MIIIFRNWPDHLDTPKLIDIAPHGQVCVEFSDGSLEDYDSLQEYLREIAVPEHVFLRSLTEGDRLEILANGILGMPFPKQVMEICAETPNRKIQPIKTIREIYGLGLKDAKTLVDGVWDDVERARRAGPPSG